MTRLRTAAVAVIDQFVVDDPDRTICLCCNASHLARVADTPLTFHREGCSIGALAIAIYDDARGDANG